MTEIFREVDEAVREDRVKSFAKRYGSWVITGILALVLGIAGYQLWQSRQVQARQAETTRLLAAVNLAEDEPTEAAEALAVLAREAGGPRAALAQLLRAGYLAESGDQPAAVAIYRAVAADGATEALWRDYAALMAVAHDLEDGDAAVLAASLDRLVAAGSPWRFSARELQGALDLRLGDRAGALETFRALADDPEAPRGLRDRAGLIADQLEEG